MLPGGKIDLRYKEGPNVRWRTTRIWTSTYRLLQVLASHRNIPLVHLVDEMARKEAERLGMKVEGTSRDETITVTLR